MRARKPNNLLCTSKVHGPASELSLRKETKDELLPPVTKPPTMSGQRTVTEDTSIASTKFSKHPCTYAFRQKGQSKWAVAYRELFQDSVLTALLQSFKPTGIQ